MNLNRFNVLTVLTDEKAIEIEFNGNAHMAS